MWKQNSVCIYVCVCVQDNLHNDNKILFFLHAILIYVKKKKRKIWNRLRCFHAKYPSLFFYFICPLDNFFVRFSQLMYCMLLFMTTILIQTLVSTGR